MLNTADFVPAKPQLEADDTAEDAEANGEPTIEDKLKAIHVAEPSPAILSVIKQRGVVPKAESLQQMLVQALHSNDDKLLEECLEIGDVRVINTTVQRLPTSYILPFLTQVVQRFQAKPGRGKTLARWIRTVLLIHMAYLITVRR